MAVTSVMLSQLLYFSLRENQNSHVLSLNCIVVQCVLKYKLACQFAPEYSAVNIVWVWMNCITIQICACFALNLIVCSMHVKVFMKSTIMLVLAGMCRPSTSESAAVFLMIMVIGGCTLNVSFIRVVMYVNFVMSS